MHSLGRIPLTGVRVRIHIDMSETSCSLGEIYEAIYVLELAASKLRRGKPFHFSWCQK